MTKSLYLLPLEKNLLDMLQVTVTRPQTAAIRNPEGLLSEKVGHVRRLGDKSRTVVSLRVFKTKPDHF